MEQPASELCPSDSSATSTYAARIWRRRAASTWRCSGYATANVRPWRPPAPGSTADYPIIHLRDRKEEGSRAPPRRRLPEGDVDLRVTGSFDHVGLNAIGLPAMRKRLEKLGIPFRDAVFPDYDLHQVFLRDPDGVKIKLNYSASE